MLSVTNSPTSANEQQGLLKPTESTRSSRFIEVLAVVCQRLARNLQISYFYNVLANVYRRGVLAILIGFSGFALYLKARQMPRWLGQSWRPAWLLRV